MSRSGYYSWKKSSLKRRSRENAILNNVKESFENSRKTYGYRRVAHELLSIGLGVACVRRVMHKNGIFAKRKRKFRITTDSNHTLPVVNNILDRQFIVDKPNKSWVSDITYIWTKSGWLYFSVFIDLFSRTVVGWSMDTVINSNLVINAFNMALKQRCPGKGLLVHSDRGSQYASHDFRSLLNGYGAIQSMSRKGNCWDNAVAESFFRTIKTELIYNKDYRDFQEAKGDIFQYVECFYNRKRIHSTLNYLSPQEYELRYRAKAA